MEQVLPQDSEEAMKEIQDIEKVSIKKIFVSLLV